jgi:diguanylate cyclase (GGDEF)-like protein
MAVRRSTTSSIRIHTEDAPNSPAVQKKAERETGIMESCDTGRCGIDDEEARLQALYRYEILDTQPEEAFDRITRLAKTVLDVPVVMVSLIDKHRQWFKSRQGIAVAETPRDISFCTHTIRSTRPFIVPDTHADPRFAQSPLVVGEPYVRFYVGVPLQSRDGYNIGALCAIDTKVRTLSPEKIGLLQDLGHLVVDELELRLLAGTDGLTGAMTRRSFHDHARREVERSRRYRTPLSCAVIDVDNFKSINDRYGHAAGDRLLQEMVAACRNNVRAPDYIGRIGGDEFALMLPETSLADAVGLAEALRRCIESVVIDIDGKPLRASVSIGVAEYSGYDGGLDRLLQDADRALYEAKLYGRNGVACFPRSPAVRSVRRRAKAAPGAAAAGHAEDRDPERL